MTNATHDASRIKTLRLAVRPGASAINQLAAALTGRRRERAALISVAGFFFPVEWGPVPVEWGRTTATRIKTTR